MRVIVSVKPTPGGGQTSQAARYIAYRDRDEEREGKEPRPLFSARESTLSFWKAERALTEGRAPQKDELVHIAVSFRDGDFQALGRNETIRQGSLREVTREAVTQIADELRADELRWVAGIHRNTDHPHIHLLIHRGYLDRDTRAERRLARLPEKMLAARIRDENGVEKVHPGSFGQAFEMALDRAQERAREDAGKEKAATSDERLLEAARANPSLAGCELTQEIILRGPHPEPDERPEASDLRAAFRTPSLDDPDYRTQPEQADWLGRQSQELRDLYERGAEVKGDVLIIPAEEHELPAGGDQPFITGLAYAHAQIRNPEQAAEFHTLARTIAGQTADPRTEIEVFRHYYTQIRVEKLERTLDEMRLLAAEMAQLETRESIEIARPVISFEDAQEAERGDRREAAENDIERDDDRGYTGDFDHADAARGDEDGRDADAVIGSFNTAARKVRLDDESLRLPAGLSLEMKLQLVARTLPALDRQMENGRARAEILTAIDEAIYRQEADENKREERFRSGGFLKAYVAERLNDTETRALNTSAAFRLAHKQITEARTPEELNRTAEQFLRENLDRGNALRLHQTDPIACPKPETMPLNHRERSLLFFGRAAEHHTTEMRELRHAWGLSRAERARQVKALHEERLSPSPVLEQMLAELDSRRSLPAIRHYQASILNEEMRNPGRLNLRQMSNRLPPHERTFLVEQIEEKKERITRSQTPTRDSKDDLSSGRPLGSIPRESHSYREYLASMGAVESRLLNEAARQRYNANGHILIGKEDHPLSITGARVLLSREEQTRIREQARHLAWEQITPPEVLAAPPEPAARAISDTIAHLQEETQPHTRLAHTVLDEFVREKVGMNGRNEMHSADQLNKLDPADAQRLRALEDYAARMREELYRGFESLDVLRHELERPRSLDATERSQSIEPNSHSAPDRDPIFSVNGHSAAKDLQLSNGGHFDPDRNSTVDGSPDDRDRQPWLVDSTRKWQFDSLRDLAEPVPMPVADYSIEHDHDFSLDR